MKYQFVREHSHRHRIRTLCRVLSVSRSGYYAHCQRQSTRREQANGELLGQIQEIHRESRQCYGSPRIWNVLQDRRIPCSQKRVARLMQTHGIHAKTKRRFKVTTQSRHTHPVEPDLIRKNFTADGPNRVWTSDITYIWTQEGWVYLAVILDVYSRMIIAWELSNRLTSSLVTIPLERALDRRHPLPGLILHSDQGSQYASREFRSLAQERGIRLSMSARGNCYANAITESFFHTLKTEHVFFQHFATREDARLSIFDYIELFYNRQRKHSSIEYLSPTQYENQLNVS
jgi:putative transposase